MWVVGGGGSLKYKFFHIYLCFIICSFLFFELLSAWHHIYLPGFLHIILNNVIVDDEHRFEIIPEDFKATSLILELKFICLNKSLIKDISNIFKNNMLIPLAKPLEYYGFNKRFNSKLNLEDYKSFKLLYRKKWRRKW